MKTVYIACLRCCCRASILHLDCLHALLTFRRETAFLWRYSVKSGHRLRLPRSVQLTPVVQDGVYLSMSRIDFRDTQGRFLPARGSVTLRWDFLLLTNRSIRRYFNYCSTLELREEGVRVMRQAGSAGEIWRYLSEVHGYFSKVVIGQWCQDPDCLSIWIIPGLVLDVRDTVPPPNQRGIRHCRNDLSRSTVPSTSHSRSNFDTNFSLSTPKSAQRERETIIK